MHVFQGNAIQKVMNETQPLVVSKGLPYPPGVSAQGDGVNFALASEHATAVALCLFDRETEKLISELPLSPILNKTGNVWHIAVKGIKSNVVYAYRILPKINPLQDLLLDPYAKCTSTSYIWGKNAAFPGPKKNVYQPLGEIILESNFDWENDLPPNIPMHQLIIYEMHVRAFTKDPSSNVSNPGTFLGLIEKIPYLVDLGVNAVELLPLQEFDELEYLQKHKTENKNLYNFWGYSTANYFSPMNRYATTAAYGASISEFKMMVKALHKHKIEVILDIVLNHTAEGGKQGSVFSFKGIDNSVYYMVDKNGDYLDFSGCGNTINANNPIVVEMIIRALRYWVIDMHVDGFRFDLASALTRDTDGTPLKSAPLIEAITKDPVLAKVKLIAEPWDAVGLYQVGNFVPDSNRWSEWNGKYRDSVRRFIKNTPWTSGEFAMRLCGSDDLYRTRGPSASINFVTCHDGFSLADLVSYNVKHNLSNNEDNRDGSNDNESWNCGVEGPTTNKKIIGLRERQMRNFHLALMLSLGVPMLCMGDEYGHTKEGNNNTWCHDDELNWFQWEGLRENADFYRFYKQMIHFRKHHPVLQRTTFLTNEDIDWHGIEPFKPDWNGNIQFIAYTLKDHKGQHDLYVAFNAQDHAQIIHLPPPPYQKQWRWVVNTSNPPPTDIYENNSGPLLQDNSVRIPPFSAIVLSA